MSKVHLSDHFTTDEARCRCGECSRFSADIRLVEVLEEIRVHFNAPVIIHSWFRCREHNNRPVTQKNLKGIYGAGSNDRSWHLTGAAADFHVKGVANEMAHWFIRSKWPDFYGVGLYDWGVHLDMREIAGNWDHRRVTTTYPA